MTMVEKMARAIFFFGRDRNGDAWNRTERYNRAPAMEQALAALNAMREPTEAMHYAGFMVQPDEDQTVEDAIWRAMIDAAIAEHAAKAIGSKRA